MGQFYNCGCSKWMHGIEDACDLYLPELKLAPKRCPFVSYFDEVFMPRVRYRQVYEENTKRIEAMRARGFVNYGYLLANDNSMDRAMGLSNMGEHQQRARDIMNTATGTSIAQQMAMQQSHSLLHGILGGAGGLISRRGMFR